MIHATARALERLRWPASINSPKYLAPVGGAACGAKYSGTNRSLDWFRAAYVRSIEHVCHDEILLVNNLNFVSVFWYSWCFGPRDRSSLCSGSVTIANARSVDACT